MKDEYLRAQQRARAASMPLDRLRLHDLLEHVAAVVDATGCDHTRAAVDAWAVEEGVDVEHLHVGLEEYGGFCDCEVVMNVDTDEVFTPARTPRA